MRTLLVVSALTLASSLPARADGVGAFGDAEGVHVLRAAACADLPAGTVRLRAGEGTHPAASPPVASSGGPSSVVPGFARDQAGDAASGERPWTVELEANLGGRSRPGNLVVVVYDGEEPGAIAAHEANALHQVKLEHAGCAALRVELSPEDGIQPNHLYRIHLVQILGGQDVVLADAQLVLR